MLGETEENWQRCVEKTLELAARQRHHLPDGAALQHDDQQGPPEEARGQFDEPVASWATKRRWVAGGVRSARARRLPRRQRLHRGEGSVANASSSTATACGRAPTWSGSASRRSATSTASTCRTSTRGRPTARRSMRGELPLGRAYRPTPEERMHPRVRAAAQARTRPSRVLRATSTASTSCERFARQFASLRERRLPGARPATQRVRADAGRRCCASTRCCRASSCRSTPASATRDARTRRAAPTMNVATEFTETPRRTLRGPSRRPRMTNVDRFDGGAACGAVGRKRFE